MANNVGGGTITMTSKTLTMSNNDIGTVTATLSPTLLTSTEFPEGDSPTTSVTTTSVLTDLPTSTLTYSPTSTPTSVPTYTPTYVPTSVPTSVPPTYIPTSVPTSVPPTYVPTSIPTSLPPTYIPTSIPTSVPPTYIPTPEPSSNSGTLALVSIGSIIVVVLCISCILWRVKKERMQSVTLENQQFHHPPGESVNIQMEENPKDV